MPVSSSENFIILERDLGYSFRDRSLLLEALTHKSFHHEHPRSTPSHNERLEFVGDSVLALTIVEYLFSNHGDLTEAAMSKIKSYLVRGSVLSEIAAGIHIGGYVNLGRGEEETGGRTKKSILADTLEAVFGAVYLDGGFNAARRTILQLFGERITAVIASGHYHDYKTELQEKSQLLFGTLPEYRIVAQEGQEHLKTFSAEVLIGGVSYGIGKGKNKKEAQTNAAKTAISKIELSHPQPPAS